MHLKKIGTHSNQEFITENIMALCILAIQVFWVKSVNSDLLRFTFVRSLIGLENQ